MKNFRSIVLNNASSEETQQEIYSALMRGIRVGHLQLPAQSLTFTTLNNTEVTVDHEPLLSCVRSSQIPIRNIKSVSVRMSSVCRSDWAALQVLFKGGVLLNEVVADYADYSPLIIEIIESGRSFRLDYKVFEIKKCLIVIVSGQRNSAASLTSPTGTILVWC